MINEPTPAPQMSSGDVYQELGPNWSNQEREVTQALQTALIPGAEVLAETQPPLGILFPPRFGYPPYQARQAHMNQVLEVDRYYRNRRDDVSGGVQGWQSSARNVGAGDVW